jgi:hypothetical protein
VYTLLFSSRCATCPSHLTLLDQIPLIFGEECKLWRSSLCSFLQASVISFLLGSNRYSPQHLVLYQSQSAFFPSEEWLRFTPIQNNKYSYSTGYFKRYVFKEEYHLLGYDAV